MGKSSHGEWCTPPVVLDCVYEVGEVALDPCSNLCSIIRAKKEVRLPEDGLQVEWAYVAQQLGGLVFVNPPYGRKVKRWIQKCVDEAREGAEIILLCAARVDTKWFQDLIFNTAAAICFWKGRIRFIDGNTGKQGDPSFFPSAIVYWGPNIDKFTDAFEGKGHMVINFREQVQRAAEEVVTPEWLHG